MRTNSPLHRVRGPDHFFHTATPSTSRLLNGLGECQTGKPKPSICASLGGTHERSRTAGLRRRLSCSGVPTGLYFRTDFGECCSRHTFARSFKASSSGSPQVRISILAKFACSFAHLATAASASCNQDGEVLLSSSQPCLSASESKRQNGITKLVLWRHVSLC